MIFPLHYTLAAMLLVRLVSHSMPGWCGRTKINNNINSESVAISESDRRRRLIPVGFVAVTQALVLSHFIIGKLPACQCARWLAEEVRHCEIEWFNCEEQFNHEPRKKSIHHINFNIFSPFFPEKGYKMAVPTCKNRLTGADVEESLCNAASRPETTVVQCNTHACPPK